MARIRTIKPEFWKSESIARLPIRCRLTFIALWSYVDDNGVGRDNERLVAAEVYPLEDDPREAVECIREDLATLARESRIVRYTVAGKRYLHVTGWSEHQKIDRPNRPRYPGPETDGATPLTCENLNPRASASNGSRQSRAVPSPGAGSKGARELGSREQGAGIRPEAGDAAAVAAQPSAQSLIAEWLDHLPPGKRPPKQVLGQVGRELAAMVDEGIPYDDLQVGLATWQARGLHPSSLASVVHAARTAPATSGAKPSTTDQRVAAVAALLPRMAALDAADEAANHRPAIGH
jgi:hypothetical protein